MLKRVLALALITGLNAGLAACVNESERGEIAEAERSLSSATEADSQRDSVTPQPVVVSPPTEIAPEPMPEPMPEPEPVVSDPQVINTAPKLVTINPDLIQILMQSTSWCVKGNGASCLGYEKSDSVNYRQILVLPAGYTADEYWKFRADFSRVVAQSSDIANNVYAGTFKHKILYYGYWLPGGALGTPTSKFGARIAAHPIRGTALTLRLNDVKGSVSAFRSIDSTSRPLGVLALFNSNETEATANASPPGFLRSTYGIAKMTVGDLESPYISTHELAHAALNFLDEYIEAGFENMNVNSIDALTPLAFLNGTWSGLGEALDNAFGTYEYRISELLAGNGNENIDVTRYPDRVSGTGGTNEFEHEGGMFFGRGTWHDRGNNLMNSDRIKRAYDDGFAYAHSGSQLRVVDQVFRHPSSASRANNRIRTAGPKGVWSKWEMGSTTKVVMYDGDKNHQFQPTRLYRVQVGWYERNWKTCWAGFVPYPCYDDIWTTAQRDFNPGLRQIALQKTVIWSLTGLTQNLLCFLGYSEFRNDGGISVNICDLNVGEVAENFLPTMVFSMPYQEASIPADQWFTKYWWRFQTWNGTYWSGRTGWSEFERKF